MKVLKFEPPKATALNDLLEMLEFKKQVVTENGFENGIVILFDKSGKVGSYSIVGNSPLASAGWLELVKQVVIQGVIDEAQDYEE